MVDLLSDVIGHDDVVKSLRKAVSAERLAPTLIFAGPSGVGKRKVAVGLAQMLVCEKLNKKVGEKAKACGECGPCVRVAKRQSESLLEVEAQGAFIKIDQARQIIKFISLTQVGRSRVVVINDAHLLNAQAANSLLKSLEEPPPSTWFILIAPSASSILPTLRSRAQVIRFGTLSHQEVAEISNGDDLKKQNWIVESAMGRMDLIEDLKKEEVAELRNAAFDFWQNSSDIHPHLTSRESALWVTRFWLGLLRDGWFFQRGLKPLIHADQMPLIESVAQWPETHLAQLSRDVSQLERDVQANADYHLAFENFIRNNLHAPLD